MIEWKHMLQWISELHILHITILFYIQELQLLPASLCFNSPHSVSINHTGLPNMYV